MNNRELKKISSLSTVILIVVVLAVGYLLYTFVLNYQPEEIPDSQSVKIQINTELYDQIKNPQSYGVPVSIEEAGFGRANPFANYKATPITEEGASAEGSTALAPE